jgi:hypothetical protein
MYSFANCIATLADLSQECKVTKNKQRIIATQTGRQSWKVHQTGIEENEIGSSNWSR